MSYMIHIFNLGINIVDHNMAKYDYVKLNTNKKWKMNKYMSKYKIKQINNREKIQMYYNVCISIDKK